jgi:hypothetical protein
MASHPHSTATSNTHLEHHRWTLTNGRFIHDVTEPYDFILKMLRKRLPPSVSDQPGFDSLSMSELLNLIFLMYGTWGTVGDFGTTFKALIKVVGEEQLWKEPVLLPAPVSKFVQ